MKVLVVIPSSFTFSPSSTSNGLIITVNEICRNLFDRYDIDFTLIGNISEQKSWFSSYNIDYSKTSRHQVLLLNTLVDIASNYDLVHIHANIYLSLSLHKVLDKIKVPVICTLHAAAIGGVSAFEARNTFMNLYSKVHVTYPSMTVHKDYCKLYGGMLGRELNPDDYPHSVISNIIPDCKFMNLDRENSVLIISRVDPIKNPVFTLKKAIEDARELSYKVNFIGDTNLMVTNKTVLAVKDQLLKLVQENSDVVTHYVKCERSEIELLLNKSKLLYHFSLGECQAVVPMEANLAGCPVVGYKEVIPHMDLPLNIMIDKKVKVSGRNFITEASNNYSDISSEFRSRYSVEAICAKWYELYQSLL